ncbi:MAG: hypothetical protein C1O27_000412 [Chloroflexi bacterium]|jgi:hypothetical protein|nr:MAG: hypothetical protein C1O27_000412 [Chloroflexota bacterium]
MDLTAAAMLANLLSFVVFLLLGIWYIAPRLATAGKANALTFLLWVHAFRHVALQVFSSQEMGFPISDGLRNEIVYGDLAGMVLALVAIIALRFRFRFATWLIALFVVATVVDLTNALIGGIDEKLFDHASGVTWIILTFLVPLLWVSLGMIVWQLWSRRREPI